jgi:23S rRNA (adenine2503-C2)-methyltransferase
MRHSPRKLRNQLCFKLLKNVPIGFPAADLGPFWFWRLGIGAHCCLRDRVTELSEHSIETLGRKLAAEGFKSSHSGPLLRAHYKGYSTSRSNDRRFPPELERMLVDNARRRGAALAARRLADDGTTKLLIRLSDGRTVESVLMPGHRSYRAAGCVSSQVGCAMGCDFCATGKAGFERSLTAGEIVEQFLALRCEARESGRRLQTVVFMGMGEPLLNLGNVRVAIERMAMNEMGGLGFRQVTVSTVGIVPGIMALAASGLGVTLAVSLHAADDATRARLLPMGRRYDIQEILVAAQRYQNATGRPVSIQYCLLSGVNDSSDQADHLARLLEGRRMHVNLLRYNPTGPGLRGETYAPSSEATTAAFIARLRKRGLAAHLRGSRGPDIDAACGQLRQSA